MDKVSWGVLGAARIAVEKVIPAMQQGRMSRVVAIASRSQARAEETARRLEIPRAHGSYEALLADDDVEAVYVPLPNHLHVPWSIKAAEAGKHVLCEKPLALTAAEAGTLLVARDRTGRLIMEAFMVRTHPQWLGVRELIRGGYIGELRAIQGFFSYDNRDPQNVRNQREIGGGGLLDIGCYPVTLSRFLFDSEPRRVISLMERDPAMHIDRLASCVLDFPAGQSSFVCSTQLVPYQRMHCFGTRGRIEIRIPFNAPPDRPCEVMTDDGRDVFGGGIDAHAFGVCNQYTIQGDRFSEAIRRVRPQDTPLEDAVQNMRVLDALFRSAESGRWEAP